MLSFTLSGKHMTYTETHAFILNHNNHITITYLIIFRNSYNELIQLLMLITDLCLFGSPIGVTELITRTYYRAYTGTYYLILVQISSRSYRAYAYTDILIHVLVLISI